MKVHLLFFAIALTLLSTGCSPVYYATNAQNVPLLKEKHEVRLNAGITSTEDASGPDVQAAYAIGENVGIIANGAYLISEQENTWQGQGKIAEVGAGYFKPISNQWVAEIFGGAGMAKITNERQNSPYNSIDLKFSKFFIQPAVGFTSNYFEIAFSPRIAWVHYSEPLFFSNDQVTVPNGNTGPGLIIKKQTFVALEPGLTIRGGWKYIKLQLQAVGSFQDIPESQDLSINCGLSLNLASRYKKAVQ